MHVCTCILDTIECPTIKVVVKIENNLKAYVFVIIFVYLVKYCLSWIFWCDELLDHWSELDSPDRPFIERWYRVLI